MTKLMNNNIKYESVKVPYDSGLLISVIMLCTIGFLAVFSASVPMCMSKHINAFHFLIQHIMWLCVGVAGLFFFSKFDYHNLKKYNFKFAIAVIILLLIVKFTPLGVVINGARRWLNFGFFQFQPSELSKLATIMLLASLFSLKQQWFKDKFLGHFCSLVSILYIIFEQPEFIIVIAMVILCFVAYLSPYIFTILIMMLIIFKQPNLSMVLILCGICGFMYICSGKTLKYIYIGFAIFVSLFVMVKSDIVDLTKFMEPHQVSRIMNWHNSETDLQGEGYQVYHSMIAISSGGIFGQGYGGSKEKHGWLPEAHTDFIFSVISEEMGFLGSFFVILLFLTLFYRGMYVAAKSPDMYGKLLAVGITSSIVMQAFFNIAVATSFLPATGITLPFVSYGGSSLAVSMSMVGVLLNISKFQRRRVIINRK